MTGSAPAAAGDPVRIARALLSVSDKTGIVDFARTLAHHGAEILSTGGTARALREAGLQVVEVAERTGFPEILDGRVKTLHPAVHGGLLARRDDDGHRAEMAAHGIASIDLVAVDLYPFERTAAAEESFAACIETIDIGGPAMIRSAAKNHAFVAVLTDPSDYAEVAAALDAAGGALDGDLRRRLAQAAFARTAAYDASISNWLAERLGVEAPGRVAFAGAAGRALRYGENPHQRAAFYATAGAGPGVATAQQVQGKALSYNNIADADAAFALASDFDEPAAVIVKHANPCGAARAADAAAAWEAAHACDPTSAFGGIVAFNRPLDAAAAAAVCEIFTEVVIAPAADAEARALFAARKNLRLLLTGGLADRTARGRTVRTVAGGLLVQDRDAARIGAGDLDVVSARRPTAREIDDMIFAFRVCKHVKSNAIVYARDGATVGIGAGQTSRLDAARAAAAKARETAAAAAEREPRTVGSVVASDAFFPFPDAVAVAAEAGATAVVQPGGSIRDDEAIAAADARGLAMVFTGVRHFRH